MEPGGIFLACAAPGWPRSWGWHLPPCPACRAKVPAIDAPFTDDFERAELGADWNATSDAYRIADGKLTVSNAHNHPAWLRAPAAPRRRRRGRRPVEEPRGRHQARAVRRRRIVRSRQGALHLVGLRADLRRLEQLAVGHLPAGGARRRPQGRRAATPASSRTGRYHFTITRQGGALDWTIDGRPFLAWTDPEPLAGAGHEYLAVDDWEATLTFDNLQIRPAP